MSKSDTIGFIFFAVMGILSLFLGLVAIKDKLELLVGICFTNFAWSIIMLLTFLEDKE